MVLYTPQLLLFNHVRQHPIIFLLFPYLSLTSFLSTGGEKSPEKILALQNAMKSSL